MKFASIGIEITSLRKTFLSLALVCVMSSTLMFSTGCNAQEFAQKFNQYAEQVYPAVNSVASILALFGIPIPAAVMPLVRAELSKVETLMNDFAGASAATQPDIRSQLVAAMQTLQADIANVFSAAHIQNPDKQVEITTLITLISSLVQEMMALIPSSAQPAKVSIAGVEAANVIHSKGDFADQFNKHIEKLEQLSPGMKFKKLDEHGTTVHALTLGLVR